jgi:hypothetical protein
MNLGTYMIVISGLTDKILTLIIYADQYKDVAEVPPPPITSLPPLTPPPPPLHGLSRDTWKRCEFNTTGPCDINYPSLSHSTVKVTGYTLIHDHEPCFTQQ